MITGCGPHAGSVGPAPGRPLSGFRCSDPAVHEHTPRRLGDFHRVGRAGPTEIVGRWPVPPGTRGRTRLPPNQGRCPMAADRLRQYADPTQAPRPDRTAAAIELRGVSRTYGQGPAAVRAVDEVDLRFMRGTWTAVM